MSGIHVISASAGTGKTTRLAKELCDALMKATARPEAVLATTFTRKAAAELQERARAALIEAGRLEDAHRLGGARIGTVNSVCGALVQDYALELGLSPDLRTVDANVADALVQEAISEALDEPDAQMVQDLASRLKPLRATEEGQKKKAAWGEEAWQASVEQIVSFARTNRLDDGEGLRESEARSVEGLLSLLPAVGNEKAIEDGLRKALDRFDKVFRTLRKTTKEGQTSHDTVEEAFGKLERNEALPWSTWLKLQTLKVGSPNTNQEAAELAMVVGEAAQRHLEHPRFRADLESWVRLCFSLAYRALMGYAERKQALGIIDFTDQERYALLLLDNPIVQEQLRDELDLVLVDEFQDTSPLQLAIFLKLAQLAKRTIWVGDQKQSIFAFRGADPALMGAALSAIESSSATSGPFAGGKTEPLAHSWRSRPELVRLTSDVFVKAFEPRGVPERGIPQRWVRIEPGRLEEPDGLGEIVELWQLDGKNKDDCFASLASCVKRLSEDETMRVRDRVTTEARRVRPGDIAVLIPMNDDCTKMASALEVRGVRSVLPRTGLLETLEGRVLVAALRLWVTADDRLARAELSRILDGASDEQTWFAQLIKRTPPPPPDGGPRPKLPTPETPDGLAGRLIAELETRRKRHPTAGAVEAVEHCLEATNLRELCLGWGRRQRLANLDALRALAVAWADSCVQERRPATAEGLVAHFDAIAGTSDAQSAVDEDAVTVSTWHSAKGLEWPITVLYVGESPRGDQAWGVAIESETEFDLAKPLAGRWIRFWPQPYPKNAKAPLLDMMNAAPQAQDHLDRQRQEQLRVLYVGWTRARDRLVLAAPEKGFLDGTLSILRDAGEASLLQRPAPVMTWAGHPVEPLIRDASILVESPSAPVAGEGTNPVGARQHPPAKVRPSDLEAKGQSKAEHRLGSRVNVQREPDALDLLGTAVHNFLSADVPELSEADRLALAEQQLAAQGVAGSLAAGDLIEISNRLRAFIEASWSNATWHREWPVAMRRDDGALVLGTADLVLETPDGFVVIDHKTFAGDDAEAKRRAESYWGQLGAYADAIRAATRRPVLATVVHMPLVGLAFELELAAGEAAA